MRRQQCEGANIVSRSLLRAAILDPSLFTVNGTGGIEKREGFFRPLSHVP